MDTTQLEVGQKVGVTAVSRYPTARIATVERKTATGQVVVDGMRYTHRGRRIGDHDYYLVSVEEAEKIIEKDRLLKEKIQAKKEAFLLSEEGIAKKAAGAVLEILNQHGYYPDVDGNWWGMMGNIESEIADYLKTENQKRHDEANS